MLREKSWKSCALLMGIQNGNSYYYRGSSKQNHTTVILLKDSYPKEQKSAPKELNILHNN